MDAPLAAFAGFSCLVLSLTPALAQEGQPLTPVIGVSPDHLDFGICVLEGTCSDHILEIFNDVNDPESVLEITAVEVTGPEFNLEAGPSLPLFLPGDGSRAAFTVRFCPRGPPALGLVNIASRNAYPGYRTVAVGGDGNLRPTCDAGGPYHGLIGHEVIFDGTGSRDPDGGPLDFAWDFGDGETDIGSGASHTYIAGGVYTVTLRVTDRCAVSATCSTSAVISETNLPPICDHGGPYSGDVGRRVFMSGNGSYDPDGIIVSYWWDFGDQRTAQGSSPSHIYRAGGDYTVTLTVTDQFQTSSTCQTHAFIGGNAPPHCNPGGPYFGNPGVPVAFDGTGSSDPDGVIVSYLWYFGDATTGEGPTPTHSYASPGRYNVILEVTDDRGLGSSCQVFAQIGNIDPTCDPGGPYDGRPGLPVTFDGRHSHDLDGIIVAYAWDFGDGGTGQGPTPSHTYSVLGTYTVTLVVTDDDGGISSCQTTAEITLGNLLPICDAGGPYEGQVGKTMTFDGTGSYDPDGTIVSYQWDFGDCETGTGPTPSHVYAVADDYAVGLCVNDNVGAGRCCQTVAHIGGPRFRHEPPGSQPANHTASLVLHAAPGVQVCTTPVNCDNVPPNVNVAPHTQYTVYLLVANFHSLTGVQTALDWPPSWLLEDVLFNCREFQTNLRLPGPGNPGGSQSATVTTAFDCVVGPGVAVIGRLVFTTGDAGCLSHVQSCYPLGIYTQDCDNVVWQIDPNNQLQLGRICVGGGGNDACRPAAAVQETTWGRIKASYRDLE